jgi:hypothetical protein
MTKINSDKIEKINNKISLFKEQKIDLENKISSTKYDVEHNNKSQNKLDYLNERINILKQELDKSILDLEDEIEKEKIRIKEEYLENRKKFFSKLQEKTLLANRCKEVYKKEELLIILSRFNLMKKIKDKPIKILELALEFERTWYGIEHIFRSTIFYLNKGRFQKKEQGKKKNGIYIEPHSYLLEECIKEVYLI